MVVSPITGNSSELVFTIDPQRIIDSYKERFDIDVRSYFEGLDEVNVYQCPDTGYRFFYPEQLEGKEELYAALQKFPWYYPEWKWEYKKAPAHIAEGSKVLEVGCGEGKYLQYLKDKLNCECTGLELNKNAVDAGKEKGIDIRYELVQEHAKNNECVYDVVCYFQVLEHIGDISDFIKASVKCLKPGGTLLICVPNNEPFLFKHIKYEALNLPPHHMGWWNTESLTKLAPYYGLEAKDVYYDPIEPYYIPGFVNMYIREKSYGNEGKRRTMRAMKPYYWMKFLLARKSIPGQHIMGVYTKK